MFAPSSSSDICSRDVLTDARSYIASASRGMPDTLRLWVLAARSQSPGSSSAMGMKSSLGSTIPPDPGACWGTAEAAPAE